MELGPGMRIEIGIKSLNFNEWMNNFVEEK